MNEIKIDFNKKKQGKSVSISAVLAAIQNEFDTEGIAQKTYDKNFNNPDSKYYQMTIEQIIESWNAKGRESMHYGQLNDLYIKTVLEGDDTDMQLFLLDNDIESDVRLANQVTAFNEYIESIKDSEKFIAREKPLYLNIENNLINGRFDALFYDSKRGKYIIKDWKITANIETEPNKWTEKLLGPAKVLDALSWNIYTLQVYFYKKALLESGYLPDGTDESDVEVQIVNLGVDGENGKKYKVFGPAFAYSTDLLNRVYKYGALRASLIALKKK